MSLKTDDCPVSECHNAPIKGTLKPFSTKFIFTCCECGKEINKKAPNISIQGFDQTNHYY